MNENCISGRYEILEVLGKGRQGSTYKAKDNQLNKLVALKLVDEHLTAFSAFTLQFVGNFQVLSKLSHPNIVPILDFGKKNDQFFLIMELMNGGALKKKLQSSKKIDEAFAKRVISDILTGAQALHNLELIHQDIHPGNILFDDTGSARLSDVFLADILFQLPAGRPRGNPAYAAPEIWLGSRPTPSSNVYSIGLIAYELLTGKLPFKSSEQTGKTRPPIDLKPLQDRDPGWQEIFTRSLAEKPEDRYPDAKKMLSDMGWWLFTEPDEEDVVIEPPSVSSSALFAEKSPLPISQVPQQSVPQPFVEPMSEPARIPGELIQVKPVNVIQSDDKQVFPPRQRTEITFIPFAQQKIQTPIPKQPISAPPKPRSQTKKPPIVPIIIGILLLGLAIVAFSAIKQKTRKDAPLAFENQPSLTPFVAATASIETTITGNRDNVINSALGSLENDQDLTTKNIASIEELSRLGKGVIHEVVYSPDGSKIAIATTIGVYISDSLTLVDETLIGLDTNISCVTWSPDGSKIATGEQIGNIIIWDVATGNRDNFLRGHMGYVLSLDWSPDGTELVSGGADSTIRVWNVETGRMSAIFEEHTDYVRGVAWSPTERIVASVSDDKKVRLWNLDTYKPTNVLLGHTDYVLQVVWSPNGRYLATSSAAGELFIWSVSSGTKLRSLTPATDWVDNLAWSPDGLSLASTTHYRIEVWDPETGQLDDVVSDFDSSVLDFAWSPDSKKFTVATNQSISVLDWKTKVTLASTKGIYSQQLSVDWSFDNQRLAFSNNSGKFYIWDPAKQTQPRKLDQHTSTVLSVEWSPSGQLASGSIDNSAIIWGTDTVTAKSHLEGHTDWVREVSWSPNGKLLATASDDSDVLVWNATRGFVEATLDDGHDHYLLCLDWDPSGNLLATGSVDGSIIVWETSNKLEVITLEEHTDWVRAVAWSPDGKLMASASDDGNILIWETNSWTILERIKEGYEWQMALEWSPDGTMLASGNYAGKMTIWDTSTWKSLATLSKHTDSVNSIAWSKDGKHLASASGDGTIRIWGIK